MRGLTSKAGKLLITAALLLCLFLYGGPAMGGKGASESSAGSLRVMSFNIRTMSGITDGIDYWTFRKDRVAELIKKHRPDLAGLQEAFLRQAKDLSNRLPGYGWFGEHRGKWTGERCPVFYRKDRLELVDHRTFWLSQTPDVKGSKSWDSAFPRVVTWGKFRDRQTGKTIFLFNTHFDHMGIIARKKSARILVRRVKEIAGDKPAVVTGDFNLTDDTKPYKTLTATLRDARRASKSGPKGPWGTSRSFIPGSRPGRRIDYVFVNEKVGVLSYAVLDDTYGRGRRPSDHMPVLASIEIE